MSDPRIILPQQTKPFPPYCFFTGLFTTVECSAIRAAMDALPLVHGTIGNADNEHYVENLDYRCVKQKDVTPTTVIGNVNAGWVFERIRNFVDNTNRAHYGFDLHGLWENIQYLRYEMEEGKPPGHYDWHQDFGGGISSLRKLSVVVQLSAPDEYEGCRLTLKTNTEFEPQHFGQGDIILFPSWTPHCVSPISKGVRSALVSWVSGPRFR